MDIFDDVLPGDVVVINGDTIGIKRYLTVRTKTDSFGFVNIDTGELDFVNDHLDSLKEELLASDPVGCVFERCIKSV